MTETILTILTTLFGGTSVISLAQALRYKTENKKLKQVEVCDGQINLAVHYQTEMLQLIETVKGSAVNQTEMLKKLDNLDARLDDIIVRTSNMETYLNGSYHAWLSTKSEKPRAGAAAGAKKQCPKRKQAAKTGTVDSEGMVGTIHRDNDGAC